MAVKLTKEMIEGAQATEKKYGVPASVTLAQIIQESSGTYSGGLSGLAYNYNNLFGVTAGGNWKGETVTLSNKAGNDTKTYRVYDSVQDSIEDHAKVLMNERYTKSTSKAKTVDEYVDGIANGGYAEDKSYAKNLKTVIKSFNLTKYDGDNWQGKSSSDLKSTKTSAEEKQEKAENEVDLKWWGDIIVLIMTILIIGAMLVFFISAFKSTAKPVTESKKLANNVKSGVSKMGHKATTKVKNKIKGEGQHGGNRDGKKGFGEVQVYLRSQQH